MHDLIQSIRNVVREEIDAALSLHFSPENFEETNDQPTSLYEDISQLLQKFAISPRLLGYKYLREAISKVYFDSRYISQMTTQLYPDIAFEFDTTPSRVERAIRHAIDVSWRRSEQVRELFPSGRRPVNGEFIATVAEHLQFQKGVH